MCQEIPRKDRPAVVTARQVNDDKAHVIVVMAELTQFPR